MTPWTDGADTLSDRIEAFILGKGGDWESLALDVHRWQVARDPVLASLVEKRVNQWIDVPAVPVGVFKDLPVGTVKPGDEAAIFRTSGTTGGGRGEHRLRSTALYELGAIAWAERCLGGFLPATVALLEDPRTAPDSSLSHMVAAFPAPATWWVVDGRLDPLGASAAVSSAATPIFLASTAFAASEWLEHAPPRPPPGSVAMITGGFKGRIHKLDETGIVGALQALGYRVVLEYGMTELSSQLWAHPGAAYRPPPWMRVVAVDPRTGVPVPDGAPGQLRFWDLANLDGTLAIETMDRGIVGSEGVTVLGRLEGAPPRGCSLTVEEAWARRS